MEREKKRDESEMRVRKKNIRDCGCVVAADLIFISCVQFCVEALFGEGDDSSLQSILKLQPEEKKSTEPI